MLNAKATPQGIGAIAMTQEAPPLRRYYPGPWEARPSGDLLVVATVGQPPHAVVMPRAYREEIGTTEHATAALIAHAPLSVEVCESILRSVDAVADYVVPSPVSAVLGSIRHACTEYLKSVGVQP
jgi:hypothetical protein